MKAERKRVVVAMSGGVDSSVTAGLLKEQGYEVIGISMQLWDQRKSPHKVEETFGSCCSLDDIYDARRVAEQLEIPFYVVNFEDEFKRLVVEDFVEEYFRGRTPNPCVRCNERVKFDLLLKKATELGADFLATGHYARNERDDSGKFHLLAGLDRGKDQSYFLFTLTQPQLSHVLFPVGGLAKSEVRRHATRLGLKVAEKGESQEICFVPDGNYARFLEESSGKTGEPGPIVDSGGKVLGKHLGTYRYTVGQRRGLGIAHSEPLYVLRVNSATREVIVGPKNELFSLGLTASGATWVVSAPEDPFKGTCKIRYRHQPVPCNVVPLPDRRLEVRFESPEKSITPGQAVVFYRDDEVIGGGWIDGEISS